MRKLRHEEISRVSASTIRLVPRHPITIVLDNVRSVHNVGSIFRTSDAALIERIILTGITATPDNPQIHKTALGAQDTVPWEYKPNAASTIDDLRNSGYTVAVLELTDTPTPTTAVTRKKFPLCLVVGNELSGVDEELIAKADFALEIQQYGAKQSMNVAVAYGIAVFDLVRQLRGLS